ncbi:MAG: hypothetical protein J6V34_02480 [Oscillospiraceae bacterium]|nr:hypothetical protein [Oscillospiraceae bacterium]
MATEKKRVWDRTKAYKEMREQMIADLKGAGIYNAYFLDKVDRFMSLWVRSKELEEDLAIRGIRVEYCNGSQRGETDNKSLDRLMKVYDRMDELHRQLGYQETVKAGRQAQAKMNADGEDDEL